MQENNNTTEKDDSGNTSVENQAKTKSGWLFLIELIFAFLLLYVGGWNLLWGINFYDFGNSFVGYGFALGPKGGVFDFNGLYYGAGFSSRFFNSPIISWVLFFLAFGVLFPSGKSETEK